jgi:hypothetical protein
VPPFVCCVHGLYMGRQLASGGLAVACTGMGVVDCLVHSIATASSAPGASISNTYCRDACLRSLHLTAQQHELFAELVARSCLDTVEQFVAYATTSIAEQGWSEASVCQMQNMAVLCSLTAFTLDLLQRSMHGNDTPFMVGGGAPGATDSLVRLGAHLKAVRSKCAGSHVDLLLLAGYIEWLFFSLPAVPASS